MKNKASALVLKLIVGSIGIVFLIYIANAYTELNFEKYYGSYDAFYNTIVVIVSITLAANYSSIYYIARSAKIKEAWKRAFISTGLFLILGFASLYIPLFGEYFIINLGIAYFIVNYVYLSRFIKQKSK